MGSVHVVVDHEAPGGLADVLEPGEPVDIEDFLALAAVGAFDVGFWSGLPGWMY